MNLHIIAAEITRRIQDMAKDSPENNEQLIFGLLSQHIDQSDVKGYDWIQDAKEQAGYPRNISFDIVWADALKAIKESRQFNVTPTSQNFNQDMFNFFAQNHGLTLTEFEMHDIEHFILSRFGLGIMKMAFERRRQISQEGYEEQHDDVHTNCELSYATMAYVKVGQAALTHNPTVNESIKEEFWPWGDIWFKPSPDAIRNWEKAGALLAAEIDRIDRQNGSSKSIENPKPKSPVYLPGAGRFA